jgi:isocitrate lyase
MASTGHTAATKAMGKGSTQVQHLVQTEVPPKLLAGWLALWAKHNGLPLELRVHLRPHTAGSEVLELGLFGQDGEEKANVLFAHIHDRRGRSILSVRDQNTFDHALRKKRLMTLGHALPHPPVQGGLRPLRGPHRGQRVPGQQDEGARDLP